MKKNNFFSVLHYVKHGGLFVVLVFITQTSVSQKDTTIYLDDVFHNVEKETTTILTKDTIREIQPKQTTDKMSSEEMIRKRLKLLDCMIWCCC